MADMPKMQDAIFGARIDAASPEKRSGISYR
jgi:hypothetical protein